MKLNKIMKKTVLATMAVLMAAALSFTGCSNGSDDDPTPGPTPTGSDGIVLFEDTNGWSEDWTAKNFTSDKFTSATNNSVLGFTVSKDTDKYIDLSNTGHEYEDCYAIIQMLDYSTDPAGKFGAGTANTTIENGIQLNLCGTNRLFEDSDPNTTFKEIIYKPTAEEWAKIKANGLGIQAHGTMFKKIVLK